jgi:hypothetical protein
MSPLDNCLAALADQHQRTLDASRAIGGIGLVTLGRLAELHFAVARGTLDDLVDPAGAGPAVMRLAAYWQACRDIQRRVERDLGAVLLRAVRCRR